MTERLHIFPIERRGWERLILCPTIGYGRTTTWYGKRTYSFSGKEWREPRQEPWGNLIGLETSAETAPFRLVLRRLRPWLGTQPSQDQSKGRGDSPPLSSLQDWATRGTVLWGQGLHLLGSLSALTIKYEDNFGIFINSFYQHEKVFLYSQFAEFFFFFLNHESVLEIVKRYSVSMRWSCGFCPKFYWYGIVH